LTHSEQISEFSYGFALTSELTRNNNKLSAAPYFPTLYAEGRFQGGYDVAIEYLSAPIFLQFKLSERLIKSNAKEYNLFNSSYFRYKIWSKKHSKQHQLLLELEKKYPNSVFYAAPSFSELNEFNKHYLNSQVAENSTFLSPNQIGEIKDLKEHCVVFSKKLLPAGYFCSEPRKISFCNLEQILEKNVPKGHEKISYQFVASLVRNMFDILKEVFIELDMFDNPIEDYEKMLQDEKVSVYELASFLSKTYFSCELLFLIKK